MSEILIEFSIDSDIEKESNVNPYFVFRQMSVQGKLFLTEQVVLMFSKDFSGFSVFFF